MSEFLAVSKEIVENFLQTAVFLDDRAMFPETVTLPETIKDPTSGETQQVCRRHQYRIR